MHLQINIAMNDAAFEDAPAAETARILQTIVDALRDTGDIEYVDGAKLWDINGNVVGRVSLTTDD